MFGSLARVIKSLRIQRYCWLVAMIACLVLPGCAKVNLRGESFKEDELSGTVRQLRPRDQNAEPWGVSNKALQIERNLGY